MAEFTWTPDRNASSTVNFTLSQLSFGDGYEHRAAKSINPKNEQWSLSFKNRTVEEILEIITFLEDRAGVYSFTYNPWGCIPDSPDVKVVCQTWNSTIPVSGIRSLNCTFRLVAT